MWQKSSFSSEGNACLNISADWQKSSYSGDASNCLDVAAEWQKSSYSYEGANCLGLATAPGRIFLRESDAPDVILAVAPQALRALIRTLKTG
ncbi:hypothetical protein AF335_10130 [Streptomyces eurocidicus]|uniref:DUF397 domain-containing protein n=1 Tax=Streptomyces eurocidicus TaxID=66423 RepID=A0A2N8NYU4_STREU|nr:hypothetical protein AF335_10130 [Streptomyces eurocidicus]